MTSPSSGVGQATVDDLTGDFTLLDTWSSSFPATVAALFSGVKWGDSIGSGATISYSFPGAVASWSTSYTEKTDYNERGSYSALTVDQANAARSALAAWAAVANVNFQEVADTSTDVGQIRISWTDAPRNTAVAWAYYPDGYWASGGDIWLAKRYIGGDPASAWQPGGADYSVLLHEIGHALGLKHPFESDLYSIVTLPASQDTLFNTVMSYYAWPGIPATPGNLDRFPSTPMSLDIDAMQYLYGANTTAHAGNDLYVFAADGKYLQTIYDTGGNDTIQLVSDSAGGEIDLRPGQWSQLGLPVSINSGAILDPDTVQIYHTVTIENAIGGEGPDRLIGNDVANQFTGNGGNDTLDGGLGIDTADYTGARSSYAITKTVTGYTVTDGVVGRDGIDTLSNIELLQFSDGLMKLGTPVLDPSGDGKSDILWRNSTDGMVALWQMNGTQIGAGAVLSTVPTNWNIIDAHGDFNGDGRSDILWRNSSDGMVALWQMNGTQIDAGAVLSTVPTNWNVIDAHGDYNGDGKSDILWRNSADGMVALWQMNGTQIDAGAVLSTVPTSWDIIDAHGDYNGDGKSDILWRNSSDGMVALWQMNGTQIETGAVLSTVPTGWGIVDAHGDYNGDGKSDILWRNSADGMVALWQMNGTQIDAGAVLSTVPTNWDIVDAHGDYNGDGKSDILWRNSSDGMVALWQMNGTQIDAGAVLSTVPMNWNIIDAHGDYNGDGKSDILWRNSADGMVALWQMNGTQIDAGAVLSTVPTNWGIIDGTESGAALTGDSGNNTLLGTVNNDTLVGQTGNDTLTGNAGADKFVFDTALDASTNVDTITDFASGTDKIMLDHLIFSALSAGNVAAGNFVAGDGAIAHEADDHILYDTATGNLSYDSDGSSGQAATLFANLANHPALAVADLAVV